MSWKKHFRPVNSILPAQSASSKSVGSTTSSKFDSWLPEIYQGPPDRLQRYTVYEAMDLDNEVHTALDTLGDFCTDEDANTKLPFVLNFEDDPSPGEIQILEKILKQWCNLNEWPRRAWGMVRSTLKYGDQIFIRDPETFKLLWVDPNKTMKVVVNESDGKKIEQYFFRDLDLNLKDMIASNTQGGKGRHGAASLVFGPPMGGGVNYTQTSYGAGGTADSFGANEETGIDAEHVVQVTMSDGMGISWPFGLSVLEYVYKAYKQKELLEDSILIYRVHRAPERRVFFIDVGTMPPNKAQQYLERIRYEVQQKRIPSRTGGGNNITDSTYNPMSMLEDYFFAVTSEGRGSKVETLPGGDNLGEIDDLRYFNNKMIRALGIPSSYIPTGPDDGSASVSDGRVGTAFMQEFRFSKICERHQRQIVRPLDEEFKLYLKHKGVTIDNSLFKLAFTTPQNFSEYRQLELDAAQINVYSSMAENPHIAKRFAMTRYLGLSEQEMADNERMWREEKGTDLTPEEGDGLGGGLSDIGVTPSGIDDMAPDDGFDDADDDFSDSDFGDAEEVGAFDEE